MKRVWQTMDGAIFDDELDAAKHEEKIFAQVKMWDKDGIPTSDCSDAMFVQLIGGNAAAIFKQMNKVHYDSLEVSDSEICEGDEGWWYWDEYGECYRPFSSMLVLGLRKIFADKKSADIKSCFPF